jgi:alkaline phosphatase
MEDTDQLNDKTYASIKTKKKMNKISNLLILIITGILLTSCSTAKKLTSGDTPEVINVIYMIGDGMGLPAVYAAMTVSDYPLTLERATTIGLQKTYSSNSYITDSGAAGTALATGIKTKNGSIGMDPLGKPVNSILKIAEDNDLATGLICTSSLTDATPASFISHQKSRDSLEYIAKDFLKTDIDLFIGGGYYNFVKRKDGLNLADSLKLKGYEVDTSMKMILKSNATKIAGFIAPLDPPFRLGGRGNMLPEATGKAINILKKNPKGFFLMVEGSQIDWAAHSNAADTLVDEILDFDAAVGVALDFAKDEGHTLVVVTADHETGGVAITGGDMKNNKIQLDFSTKGHTAVMVPVYAFGPGSEKFTGIYDNTQLFQKILSSLGLSQTK